MRNGESHVTKGPDAATVMMNDYYRHCLYSTSRGVRGPIEVIQIVKIECKHLINVKLKFVLNAG